MTVDRRAESTEAPWYRQGWPIFVFSLPATAVIASFISLGYAIAYRDDTVGGEYYKEGLAINRLLALEDKAWQARIAASLTVDAQGSIKAILEGNPETVQQTREGILRISHPQDAALDQVVAVTLAPDRALVGHLRPLDPRVHWALALQTREWRITGSAQVAPGAAVRLFATPPVE